MIQMETLLRSADNSGAKFVKCIKVLGGLNRRIAKVGDRIIISINYTKNNKKINKKGVYSAIILNTKSRLKRADGSQIRFDRSRAVVVNEQFKLIGTRIYGIAPKEVKTKTVSDLATFLKGAI